MSAPVSSLVHLMGVMIHQPGSMYRLMINGPVALNQSENIDSYQHHR